MVTRNKGSSDPPDQLRLGADHARTDSVAATNHWPHDGDFRSVDPFAGGDPERAPLSPEPDATIETRDAFLAAVAHELRAPLAALNLSAQVLIRQLAPETTQDLERSRHMADIILRQSDKMDKLITYLLDVSRSGQAALPLNASETDLVALTEVLAEGVGTLTNRHQLRVVAAMPVSAVVDATRIEQVLTNLIDNAIKYSPDGGLIEVAIAQTHQAAVSISVTDQGIGVPPEHRPYMFDRFSRAHDPKMPGLGLGLYLCQRIVELHGGRLEAEFPAAGGTRLVMTLPHIRPTEPPRGETGGHVPHVTDACVSGINVGMKR